MYLRSSIRLGNIYKYFNSYIPTHEQKTAMCISDDKINRFELMCTAFKLGITIFKF